MPGKCLLFFKRSCPNYFDDIQIADTDNDISLEEFASSLASNLSDELDRILPGNPLTKGFGIHLTGFEHSQNHRIPEMFLISNFDGMEYVKLKDSIICERHLYPLVPSDASSRSDDLETQREAIASFLDAGNIFLFNNGDPELFTPISAGYHDGIKRLRTRNRSRTLTKEHYREMSRAPVEIISKMQRSFSPIGKRLVGGKIHDLVITSSGQFSSTSGIIS